MMYVSNTNQNLIISDLAMSTSSCLNNGGVFYFSKVASVDISDSSFTTFSATSHGSLMYSVAPTLELSFTTSTAQCLTQYFSYADDVQTGIEAATPTYSIGGAFYIDSAISITSSSNTFGQCYLCDQGSIFQLYNTVMTDDSSTYTDNAALYGGVIYASEANVTMTSPTFTENIAIEGGVFYMMGNSPLSVTYGTFQTNWVLDYGGIGYYKDDVTSSGTNTVEFIDSTFDDQYAGIQGGAFYIDSDQVSLITWTSVTFTNSSAPSGGGIMYVKDIGGGLVISDNSLFSVFWSSEYGSFLYSITPAFYLQISDSIVQCNSSYSYYNATQQIGVLKEDTMAGAFYIGYSTDGVNSSDNKYRWCYPCDEGGIYTLISTKLDDYYSNFYQNAALNGGVIKCESCNLTLTDDNFYRNIAQEGGVILIDNDAIIVSSKSSFYQNHAYDYGGVISSIASSLNVLNYTTMEFDDCSGIYQNWADYGGFISINNPYMSLEMSNCPVKNTNATIRGGIIDTTKVKNITIEDTEFDDFYAPDSAFMYSISQYLRFKLDSNTFTCNSTYKTSYVKSKLNLDIPSSNSTTTLYIANAILVTSSYNTFTLCGPSLSGGVFYLTNSNFTDSASTFTKNSGEMGGAVTCSNCLMNFTRTTFTYNIAHKGGVIKMDSEGAMRGIGLVLQNNLAYQSGGVMYLVTESYFTILNSEFSKNTANETSTIDVLGSSSIYNNTLSNCIFKENSAQKNTISFMYALTYITNSQFIDNKATTRTKNIFCGFSTIYVEKSYFRSQLYNDTTIQLKLLNLEETSGTFFYIIIDVSLVVTNSQFLNGQANEGGAIYISGDASVRFSSCQFTGNMAKTLGGAIYAVGFVYLEVSGGTQLANNTALVSGDDFYVGNTESYVNIDNVNITNPKAKTSIYADTVALRINKVTINQILGGSKQGSALYCMNCRVINITNSSFSNMKSQQGGAFYIEENKNNKLSSDKYGKYSIKHSNISNATAIVGGAIYLNDIQYMTIDSCIITNSTVYNSSDEALNSSAGSGGAIYYTCDSVNLNCDLDIIGSTKFKNNYASIKGGAIHWEVVEPDFGSNILYQNNTAAKYGNNISCFAQRLAVITRQEYMEQMKKLGFVAQNASRMLNRQINDNTEQEQSDVSTIVMDQRSGGVIPDTYLAHVDKYNQIVGSDSDSKVQVLVDGTYSAGDIDSLVYSPTIEGNSQFQTIGGAVSIQNVTFSGSPGYNYSIVFTTNGIDKTKVSNKAYMTKTNVTDINFDMYVDLRECEVGEQFTTSGKCVSCPNGTSYSLVQMTAPGSCQSCPTEKAVCYGGTNVGPKPGYWRSSNTSDDFIACLYAPACLGMIPPENNPQGSCYTGYQGILCADCAYGYSRGSEYKCSKCPTPLANGLRISFIFVVVVFLLVFLIWSTLSGAKNKRNVTSIYTKILMNHIQLILLTASFNFNWPEQVVKFFAVAKPVAEVTTQIFSFDCFLQTGVAAVASVDTTATGIRIVFQKEVMIAALPILMAICSFIFWYSFACCCKRKGKVDIMSRVISTLVILLFLAHPNIVQMLFYNFKCYDIDGVGRLMDDLQVVCWSQWHKLFSYCVAIPGIVVWGLGIPFFGFVLLTRVKNKLDAIEVREKLGFLYRGYKNQFYYFEIVIMYRKITLIFIAVFISAYGVIAQALIVFMVLIIFLIVSAKKKPFSTIALNDLEVLSLITSMLTVYCGLFFISDTPEYWLTALPEMAEKALELSNGTRLFFFFVIVFVNLIFLAYWSYKMYLELVNKFRKSLPKIYTFLCLCNSQAKFEREKAKQKIQEENEHLHEEFSLLIKNVKKLHSEGKLILTENIIERLGVYLDQDRILDAAGANNKVNRDIAEKLTKRYDRIKESNFKYQSVQSKIEGGKNQIVPFDSSLLDETQFNGTTELNDPYHKYENAGGKMTVPSQKNWLKVDDDILGEFNEKKKVPPSRDGASSYSGQLNKGSTFASHDSSEKLNMKKYLKGEFQKHGRQFGIEPSQSYRSSDTDQIFSHRLRSHDDEEEKGNGLDLLEGQIFEEHYQEQQSKEEEAQKIQKMEAKFVKRINNRMADAAQRAQIGEEDSKDLVIEKRKVNKFKKAQRLHAEIIKSKNDRIQQKINVEKGGKERNQKGLQDNGKKKVVMPQEKGEGEQDIDNNMGEVQHEDREDDFDDDEIEIPETEGNGHHQNGKNNDRGQRITSDENNLENTLDNLVIKKDLQTRNNHKQSNNDGDDSFASDND